MTELIQVRSRLAPRALRGVGLLALGVLAAQVSLAAEPASAEPERPQLRITTDKKFDSGSIRPYRRNYPDIYRHIDAEQQAHVAELQRWVRQPSISAQGIGITEMAQMLRDDLRALGFQEAQIVPTDGHPGVWGYYDAGAKRTLALYMMYDVQPVVPEDWRTPPFEGNLVDTELGNVLMARGAMNQKGPQRALLNAIDSILKVRHKLPVNLMVIAEGEEELGSPHFAQVVSKYEQRLRKADGVFFPFNSQIGTDGRLDLYLGVKGYLYFELESRGGPQGGPTQHEIHGSFRSMVDSPATRLVQALATFTEADGSVVRIPGFYDQVVQPNEEQQMLLNALADRWDDAQVRKGLGVERWLGGKTGRDMLLDALFLPSLNIDGIWSGYTGEGVKTVLPHVATAKVDARLLPGTKPAELLAHIRAHLDRNGYSDIKIKELSSYQAAQFSVYDPFVRTAISVLNKYGDPPVVQPRLPGSAPFYVFTERLGLPMVFSGLGHGANMHAPNEYMVIHPKAGSKIAGLADIEKAYVDFLYALAES
jgi:acetylornithine deacetylase/succinyl-diaminopimelate desuccinylase-like protein